jgi:hypothetical protein
MNNFHDIFKELRKIQPDEEYTRTSREFIMRTPQLGIGHSWRKIFLNTFEYGAAIALVVFLLVMISGSSFNIFSPFRLASLNPGAIRAEAEAIDIQMKLLNLTYPDFETSSTPKLSTVKTSPEILTSKKTTNQDSSPAGNVATTTASDTSSTPIGPDEAVDLLSGMLIE